jgi:hypothetical protein
MTYHEIEVLTSNDVSRKLKLFKRSSQHSNSKLLRSSKLLLHTGTPNELLSFRRGAIYSTTLQTPPRIFTYEYVLKGRRIRCNYYSNRRKAVAGIGLIIFFFLEVLTQGLKGNSQVELKCPRKLYFYV